MIPNYILLCIRLLLPGGLSKIASEHMAFRKQLIAMSRGIKRAPKLTTSDRIIFGMLASMISPKRLARIAIILKPATLLKFHKALVKRKYRLLFSNKKSNKGGRKGLDKDVVRRILITNYKPNGNGGGPSWLTFIGHMKDSLWSIDFFCCE